MCLRCISEACGEMRVVEIVKWMFETGAGERDNDPILQEGG